MYMYIYIYNLCIHGSCSKINLCRQILRPLSGTSKRPLRSSDRLDLFVPRVRTTMVQSRSSVCIGPSLWNRLLPSLRSTILSSSISTSFSHLHTYVHIYKHIYIHTYIYIYIHIYKHTYIHNYIHADDLPCFTISVSVDALCIRHRRSC